MDKIEEFIESLPEETLTDCYVRNAARHADKAITAKKSIQSWHKQKAREYRKLAREL